jgi:hypothetical protein
MEPDPFIYLEFIRKSVSHLPLVTEASSYGTPGFFVQKKLFARMKEDGETLVIYTEEREKWMQADPDTFYITDHYLNYSYMLIRLQKINPDDLKQLLTHAWLKRASKTLVKQSLIK